MADVLSVAKYIVEKQGSLTTMKLQKLTYYCQAWSLAWDDKPLFDEDFEAWANGPVCRKLYSYHRGIFAVDKHTFLKDYDVECNFTQEEIDTIEQVLSFYGDKESHWLSELTHKEDPWKNARVGYAPGEPAEVIINKEAIQAYYSGLL